MARYIMRLRPGAAPEDLVQSAFSITENAPLLKITKLYDSGAQMPAESAAAIGSGEVNDEINEIRDKLDRTYVVEMDDKTASSMLIDLSQDETVESITPDEDAEEYLAPNDPEWENLYGLHLMECADVWPQFKGEEVLIAVVDSGIDTDHTDLSGNLWSDGNGHHGFNEVDGNHMIDDDTGHGTHVAGTIGAIGNNGIGVSGVAPRCRILPIKGLLNGKGKLSILLRCIRKAVDTGAKVVNNSWGPGNRNNPDTDLVLRYAYLHDVTVVFAAGNNGKQVTSTDIASHPHAICVAAVDKNDTKPKFSNYGNFVSVSAPGVSILSTGDGNNYTIKSGTSMAAPHVSGLVGLMLSKNSSLKPDQIKAVLQQATDPTNGNQPIGSGRVNAKKAMAMV